MGSRGAHTPCHQVRSSLSPTSLQDTYGTNLVAQVEGSKTWLLFPPSQGNLLSPTRIPYEESSVYSKCNFLDLSKNCPSMLALLAKTTPYTITLRKGEVPMVDC